MLTPRSMTTARGLCVWHSLLRRMVAGKDICLVVHNNIKGAKGAFLGGITGTGRISKEVWGTGLSPLGDGWGVWGVGGGGRSGGWRRAVSFTVSLSRGVSFAPEYAHRFFGRNVMLPPLWSWDCSDTKNYPSRMENARTKQHTVWPTFFWWEISSRVEWSSTMWGRVLSFGFWKVFRQSEKFLAEWWWWTAFAEWIP